MTAWKRKEVIGNCSLYLGDCVEVIPTIEVIEAIVTDPPYGISINKSNRISVSRGFAGQTWDSEPADLSWLLPMNVPSIVWGGNYFNLPPHRGPLVWDKNNAGRDFADFEMAWTNIDMVGRRFVLRPMNMDGGKVHPTQKPEELMKWCLSFIPAGLAVMDPYMGSGSTGVACVKTGRSFIGIEREPSFFDIACERVHKAYAQPDMFVERAPDPKQEAFL